MRYTHLHLTIFWMFSGGTNSQVPRLWSACNSSSIAFHQRGSLSAWATVVGSINFDWTVVWCVYFGFGLQILFLERVVLPWGGRGGGLWIDVDDWSGEWGDDWREEAEDVDESWGCSESVGDAAWSEGASWTSLIMVRGRGHHKFGLGIVEEGWFVSRA